MSKEKQKMEKEMGALDSLIARQQQTYNKLLKEDIVQQFKKVDDVLSTAIYKRKELKKNYEKLVQKNCPHFLWYLFDSMTDDHEGRTYWKCKCLDCGLMKEDRSREFENVIMGNKNIDGMAKWEAYEKAKDLYHQFVQLFVCEEIEDFCLNKEEVAELLVKKLNNKGKK